MASNPNNRFLGSLKATFAILGAIATLIALLGFFTGIVTFDQITDWLNGWLPNPIAEENGILWDATFYGNTQLNSPVILQGKIRGALNGLHVEWGVKSPSSPVPVDYFSATFHADPVFDLGTYCFVLEVDDGARIYIDGTNIRNIKDFWWGYTPGAVYRTPVRLNEGSHSIELQYFENNENAFIRFSWYKNAGSECASVGHPGVP